MSTSQNSKVKIQKSASKAPQTMAELMSAQNTSVVAPRKGEMIPGTITKLTSSEILVNVNAKAEAVVLEKDRRILHALLASLKVGDKVTVQVLNPESDMGYPVVSLRKFLDNLLWGRILKLEESKEVLEVIVNEAVRGGFLVATKDGISGFLPNSQVSFASQAQKPGEGEEHAQDLIGHAVKAVILEVDRLTNKIIFSQTQTMGKSEFDAIIKKFKIGQKVQVMIKNITPYGIFVSVPFNSAAIDGFIHISEISWEKISQIPSSYQASENIDAYVLGFDQESRRLNLSIKMLTSDPFREKVKNFLPDKKIKGKVMQVSSFGISLDLGEGIEGFIRKEKIPPAKVFNPGDVIDLTVSEIDERRRKVILVPVLTEKPIGYR
ncbi:MAG: S1 RNA-binding domain-containing protein [Patescibacteria group bacterium]|nr:S1 RNA-binding domain-containing protein [Patescibacteria group bacterium]